uniref:Enoyl-CoA hydratase n=1 Tax=Alexandrium catenella TaxID=2925 RepID=A0A7S1MJR6_ALECA
MGGEKEEPVLYETTDDGLAIVTLNRPERMNAWTGRLGQLLFDAYDRAAEDPKVRVIVLTGRGRAFCAGADMGGLAAESQGKKAGSGGGGAKEPPRKVRLINHGQSIPKPIICAINGACAGLGLAQALAADIRFAAAGAKITTSFARRGLIAEHGTSWALPHIVGLGNAMDLLLTARVMLAEEAKDMGLVQKVFPKEQLMEETLRYARELAANVPPMSMAVIKRQLLRHPLLPPDEALHSSNRLMGISTKDNPDYAEGVKSFMEKRPPAFRPFDPNAPLYVEASKL